MAGITRKVTPKGIAEHLFKNNIYTWNHKQELWSSGVVPVVMIFYCNWMESMESIM